jgi:hypothetical protein
MPHFQSDAFHYLHHRYFECNYAGTDAAFMDVAFGTYRGALADTDSGGGREDAKSTLRVVPTREFLIYLGGSAACFGAAYLTHLPALAVSVLTGFGPVGLAVAMSSWSDRGSMNVYGYLLHIVMGILFCSVPVTYMCWLALA